MKILPMKTLQTFTLGVFMLLGSGFVVAQSAMTSPSASLSSEQVKQVQQIVHDYLVSNPQILVEVSTALQQQEMTKAQEKARTLIATNAKALFNNVTDPVVGSADADATLVEFFDYQCPHCKSMTSFVGDLVQKDAKVRVVFKELPIFGGNSQFAAKAALASQKQGKYLAVHNALMKADNPLTNDKVLQVAKSAGVDTVKLQADMKEGAIDQQLKDNFTLAKAILQPSIGIIATPAFIASNRAGTKFAFIPGQTDAAGLQQAIAQVR